MNTTNNKTQNKKNKVIFNNEILKKEILKAETAKEVYNEKLNMVFYFLPVKQSDIKKALNIVKINNENKDISFSADIVLDLLTLLITSTLVDDKGEKFDSKLLEQVEFGLIAELITSFLEINDDLIANFANIA